MPEIKIPQLVYSTFREEANKPPYTRDELEIVLDWLLPVNHAIKEKNELKYSPFNTNYTNGDYRSS